MADELRKAGGTGAELAVRLGATGEGAVLKIKPRSKSLTREAGNVHVGTVVAGWTRIAVLTSKGPSARFFILEPGSAPAELAFDAFYIRGPFVIASKQNNARVAREAWAAFKAAARSPKPSEE